MFESSKNFKTPLMVVVFFSAFFFVSLLTMQSPREVKTLSLLVPRFCFEQAHRKKKMRKELFDEPKKKRPRLCEANVEEPSTPKLPTALEHAAQVLDLPRVLFKIVESYVGFQGVLCFTSSSNEWLTTYEKMQPENQLKLQRERDQMGIIWDKMGWTSMQDVWKWFKNRHFTQQANLLETLIVLGKGRTQLRAWDCDTDDALAWQIEFEHEFASLTWSPKSMVTLQIRDDAIPINMLAILPHGLLASDSCLEGMGPQIWNPKTCEVILLEGLRPTCMAAIDNGFAWGTELGDVHVHQVGLNHAGEIQCLRKHLLKKTRITREIVALEDDKLVAHYTKVVCVWNTLLGTCLQTFDACYYPRMTVLPEQKIVSVENLEDGSGQRLCVINVNTGEHELRVRFNEQLVHISARSVFFMCGKLFLFSYDSLVAVLK